MSNQDYYSIPQLEFDLQNYEISLMIRESFIKKFDIEEIKCRFDNDGDIKQKLKYLTPIHQSFDYFYYLIKTISESDHPNEDKKKYLEYIVLSQSFQNQISERCYLVITQANSIDNLEEQIEQLFQIFFLLKDIDINILQKSNISLIFTLQKIIEIQYPQNNFNALFQKFDDFLILIQNCAQEQQYKTIPVYPQPLECIQYGAENNQFFGQTIEQYQDQASYLDYLFNFLREDYIYYIREEINYLSEKGFFKPIDRSDTRNICLYQDIKLIEFKINNLNVIWKISLKQFNLDNRIMIDEINWNYSNKLKTGSLICITNIECHPLLFAIITNRSKQQDDYEISNRINLEFRFLGPKSQIMEFLNLLSQQTILMECKTTKQVEAQIYNLEAIKKMDQIPKKKLILEYLSRPYYYQNYQLSKCFPELLKLCDPEQEKAIQLIFHDKLAFIQGLPGTGKTYCGTLAVRILNERLQQIDKPILIVCYNNHTLDYFLEQLLQFIPANQIVRLGGNSKSARINSYTFQSRSNIDFIQDEFTELKNQLTIIFNRLIQYEYTINPQDITRFWLELKDKIIHDFLQDKDLNSTEIDEQIQNQILNSWINVKSLDDDPILQYESKKFGVYVITQKEQIIEQVQLNDIFGRQPQQSTNQQDQDQQPLNQSNQNEEPLPPIEQFNKQNQNQSNLHYNFIGIQKIQQCLQDNTFNIWELNYKDICEIIKYLKYLKYQEDCLLFEKTHRKYKKVSQTLQNLSDSNDIWKLKKYQVVGVTVTDAAYYSHVFKQLNSKVLIVEEVEQILLSNLLTILTNKIEYVILFGDCFNLEEKLQNYDQTNLQFLKKLQKQQIASVVLSTQWRMKTKVSSLVRSMYNYDIMIYYNFLKCRQVQQVLGLGLNCDFLIFNHKQFEYIDSDSKENAQEAEMIVLMVKYLIQAGNKESQITVLSLYQQQVQLIKEKFRKEKQNQHQVRVETVEDYLGEENDIVIISLVINDNDKIFQKTKYQNIIKTAFSRAKLGLYVFGYFDNIRLSILNNSFFGKIISLAKDQNCFSDFIPVRCHIHGTQRKVYKSSDWFNTNGSCCNMVQDQQVDNNNHTCYKQDLPGIQSQNDCQEICENILICQHQCQQRCQAQCICTQPIFVRLPGCKHTTVIKCGEDPAKVLCQQVLEICFLSSCKHITQYKCYQREKFLYKCQHDCRKVLKCGHRCNKKCYEDCQPCEQKCIKNWTCGHKNQCKNLCYQKCSLCSYIITIQLSCGMHSIQKKCFQIKNHLISDLKMPPSFLNSKIGLEFEFRIYQKLANSMINEMKNFEQIQDFQCRNPCSRPRKCGHKFKCNNLCTQECTPCEYVILLPVKCGHKYQLLCKDAKATLQGLLSIEEYGQLCQCEHEKLQQSFENCIKCRDKVIKNIERYIKCQEKCIRKRRCGHQDPCLNKCCYQCSPCLEIITITSDCGHKIFVECSSKQVQCQQPCSKTRACEHYYPCSNYCSQPCSPCQVDIAITLPCGHLKLVKCYTVQTNFTGIRKEQDCEICQIIY